MFTFIDLFAGIGGMRIAMEDLGGTCVFSSEKDPKAASVYFQNFGDIPQSDICELDPSNHDELPDFDIMLAGFPCQAFSKAGLEKGFKDRRGRMFEHVARIIRERRPKAFLLENVKGLQSLEHGSLLGYILRELRELGYYVPEPKVLNSEDYNVPQKRERLYIVGFRSDLGIDSFEYPKPLQVKAGEKKTLGSIRTTSKVPNEYWLSQTYLDCLKLHKERQKEEKRGFSYCVLDGDSAIPNTALVGGMGRERNLIVDHSIGDDRSTRTRRKTPINDEDIRCLTPREFLRMQGFPEDFELNVAKTHAYRLVGNSVAIDVVYYIGLEMMKLLKSHGAVNGYTERSPISKKYAYDLSKV